MVHDGRAPKCCGAFPPQQEVPKGADLYTVYFAHLEFKIEDGGERWLDGWSVLEGFGGG